MEYGSTVWDNTVQKNIDAIEKVQRRAARFVLNNYQRTASVSNMIDHLEWNTLQDRRSFTNLVMFYKIRCHLVAIPQTFLPQVLLSCHLSRNNHYLAYLVPFCRIEAYKQSFVPRTARMWNILPPNIVSSDSLEVFKDRLTVHML